MLKFYAQQKTERFMDKAHIFEELEQYGGMIDCQTFRYS